MGDISCVTQKNWRTNHFAWCHLNLSKLRLEHNYLQIDYVHWLLFQAVS